MIMRLNLLILTLLINCLCYSQEGAIYGSANIQYKPSETGCHKDLELHFKFDKYLGIETVFWARGEQKLTGFKYEGRFFSLVELGYTGAKTSKSSFKITAEIHELTGGNLGIVTSNLIDHDGESDFAIMQDYTVLEDDFPSFNQNPVWNNYLSLENINVIECYCDERKELIELAKKKVQTENYDECIIRATTSMKAEDYQEAYDQYLEALKVKSGDEVALKGKDDAFKKMKEERDLEDLKKEEANTSNDDFWNNGGDLEKDNKTTEKDDFWENGGETSDPVKQSNQSGNNSEGFWDNGGDLDTEDGSDSNDLTPNYQIEMRTNVDGYNKYGIVDTNGVVLIPFKFDHIFSYEDGLAKVAIEYEYRSQDYDYISDVYLSYNRVGRVSKEGEWLSPPKRICYYWYYMEIYLVTSTTDEARKKRALYKERELVERKEYMQQIESAFEGIMLETNFGYE